jgi:hypothetical protein
LACAPKNVPRNLVTQEYQCQATAWFVIPLIEVTAGGVAQ